MRGSNFRYTLPQAFKSLKSNGWMTFASVFTIAISLFLCVFFWLIIVNLDVNATILEDEVEIVAYISPEVPESEYSRIEDAIILMDGYQSMTYISKEEGLASLAPRFGGEEDLLDSLGGENPLPNCYAIKATSPEKVVSLAEQIGQLEQIDTVRYGQGTVENLFTFTALMRKAGLVIMGLLAFAAVVLVAMTTRISVYARKKEMLVMTWVGATNWYIRWPFLLEGVILGLVGSAIAVGVALLLYNNAVEQLRTLVSFIYVVDIEIIWGQIVLYTVGAGVLMGALGSTISMARFLNV